MPPRALRFAVFVISFSISTGEYPHVKNASAQSYAFKSTATLLNTMTEDLEAWRMFIGFQHDEILVSVSGAVITDGTDYPAHVGNGTSLSGFPQSNLLNAIDTAGDLTQIQVKVDLIGTQFGVKPPGIPMPKTIKLENDGFRCPAPSHKGKYHT
ncbi:putative COBRA-like protein 10 [Cocos nucifera]|uniref:Putative COBRA-like protein 10 n=1 Tax=Cocos nucifera TaxID=13894 RepID=A0A8K0NC87_COCNU|nr:putative COBRA-like protein 10 [Cocos nucifera]